MKRILCAILLVSLCCWTVFGEEPILYHEVYYDDKPGENHFPTMALAIAHVAEGGTIYLGKPIEFKYTTDKTIEIHKSMKIQSTKKDMKAIAIDKANTTVFKLMNVPWFELEGVYAIGSNGVIIAGKADNITIRDSWFESCIPIGTTSPGPFKVTMESNRVSNGNMSVQPSTGKVQLTIYDNIFNSTLGNSTYSVVLKNCILDVQGNDFNGYAFKIDKGNGTSGHLYENIFRGSTGKIFIREEGENIHIHHNKILKNIKETVYYEGAMLLDATQNWWNSREGPTIGMIEGKVDYSKWALFDDFRRFHGDPYQLEDVVAASTMLGQTVDEENWIYDIQQDGEIDFLDMIGLTRLIKKGSVK